MEFSRTSYLQKLVRADGNGMIKIVTASVGAVSLIFCLRYSEITFYHKG